MTAFHKGQGIDTQGQELVRQLHISLGNKVRDSGDDSYDLLIHTSSGEIHAEVKAAKSAQSDFFAINSVAALRRFFTDKDYCLCFCVLGPQPTVLQCKAPLLLLLMGWQFPPEPLTTLESLESVIAGFKMGTRMPLDCRVRFHLRGGIAGVLQVVRGLNADSPLRGAVDGVWVRNESGWSPAFGS